jgi:hypothetical protein
MRYKCSDLEKEIAKRLQNVRYLPGSFDKRFVQAMEYAVNSEDGITDKQRETLLNLLYKYRAQVKDYEELKVLVLNEYKIVLQKGWFKYTR